MTYSDTQPRGTLRYRLLAVNTKPYDATLSDPGSWGHEYVRHLAAEIHEEFAYSEEQFEEWDRLGSKEPFSFNLDMDGLRMLAAQCAKFFLSHNAEPDAVDIMDEVGRIANIGELVDENTYRRVCTYMVRCVPLALVPSRTTPTRASMTRCVNYLIPADGDRFLRQAHDIYLNHSQFPEALALAIRLGDPLLVRRDYEAPANPSVLSLDPLRLPHSSVLESGS
jgi:26S proteasome regulatory subunit N1